LLGGAAEGDVAGGGMLMIYCFEARGVGRLAERFPCSSPFRRRSHRRWRRRLSSHCCWGRS
jgi:hypothetical protein